MIEQFFCLLLGSYAIYAFKVVCIKKFVRHCDNKKPSCLWDSRPYYITADYLAVIDCC